MRPCHWGYGRPLPCRLDHRRLRRRFRRLPSLALGRLDHLRLQHQLRRLPSLARVREALGRLGGALWLGLYRTGGRRSCARAAQNLILFIGGPTDTCATLCPRSIGILLLLTKHGTPLRRRPGRLRRRPTRRVAMLRIRRMAYLVCRRKDLVVVHVGRAALWFRLMVFIRAFALT